MPGITDTFSISPAQAGQTVTAFTLCYAISAPVLATLAGGLSVRVVLVIALGIFTVANAASALAGNFAVLLIARAIAGLSAGLFAPIAIATAAGLVASRHTGLVIGVVLGGMSAGTVIRVPIGLWVNDLLEWRGALFFVTAMGLLALVGFSRFPAIPVRPPPSLSVRFSMLTNRYVAVTVSVTFLTAVGDMGLYTYIAPILHTLAGIDGIKPYLWLWGLGGLAGSFAVGPLIDRTKRPALILTGILILLGLSLNSLPALAPHGWLMLIPFFIWGAMGWASLAPQQHALLAAQPDQGAAAVALNSSFNYLGGAAGTLLGGVLLARGVSMEILPYCAGGVICAALVVHLVKCYMRSDAGSKG